MRLLLLAGLLLITLCFHSSTASSTTAANTSTYSVLQITETEVYDGRKWRGAHVGRWTNVNGTECLAPTAYDEQWTSDWKIVTGDNRDEFGWEYEYMHQYNPTRRRIWLRTYRARKKKKRRRQPRVFKAIRDDFNFKGFGWTFYKSLVFRDSVGAALRLPLTYNSDLWDSHPSWPSISTSFAVYVPNPTAILFLNMSVRIEWIQWVVHTLAKSVLYSVVWVLWTFVIRGLVLALSALVFPLTRTMVQAPEIPVTKPDWSGPQYNPTMEERIGMSWSWRVSQKRGFEYRQSYWHLCQPSLVSIAQKFDKKIPNYLLRHSTAVGLSTSGPIPDEPFLTCSAIMAMSGFYFRKQQEPTVSLEKALNKEATVRKLVLPPQTTSHMVA